MNNSIDKLETLHQVVEDADRLRALAKLASDHPSMLMPELKQLMKTRLGPLVMEAIGDCLLQVGIRRESEGRAAAAALFGGATLPACNPQRPCTRQSER